MKRTHDLDDADIEAYVLAGTSHDAVRRAGTASDASLTSKEYASCLRGKPPATVVKLEARAASQMVRSSTLWQIPLAAETQAAFEAAGFAVGRKVDAVLTEVQLPVGWRLVATDDARRRDILDAASARGRYE
jgi:hypothetical protein